MQGEAERVVPELAGRGECERHHQYGGRQARRAEHPQGGRAIQCGERGPNGCGRAEVEAKSKRESGQRSGAGRRSAGEQDRSERKGQRGGVGVRKRRMGHRHDGRNPDEDRDRRWRVAADEPVCERGHQGVERDAHDAPCE